MVFARMPRIPLPRNPLATILAQIHQALARVGRDCAYTLTDIRTLKEEIMARFDELNTKLDEQDAARTAATERIAADVQNLRDQIARLELDTDDQEAVDAVVGRIQSNIDALNAIDPVRADDVPSDDQPATGGPDQTQPDVTDPAANPNEPAQG